MEPINCGYGHFYDPEKYASCPYCNNSSQRRFNLANMQFEGDLGDKTVPLEGYGPSNHGPFSGDSGVTEPVGGGFRNQETLVDDGPVTTSVYEQEMGIDPAVGWLVCIDGPDKGKDYRLYGRINTIGRDATNDVCISGDETISRDRHARLSYDPDDNLFVLSEFNNKNVIRVNNKLITSSIQLKLYDLIKLGKSILMFVPLCSDGFTWESGVRERGGR